MPKDLYNWIAMLIRSLCLLLCLVYFQATAQKKERRVIAFFTARNDLAHINFVHEANRWFDSVCTKYKYQFDSTKDWSQLESVTKEKYALVIFLDTRPESPEQRAAFEKYMNSGGAFMGFHFSAFALTPSGYNGNWKWYNDDFLGCGEYKGNTWRPTSAILRVENKSHPSTRKLAATISSAPNEWYSWQHDLRNDKNISILLSIDSSSFPLGTGPKQHEIWKSGYYPVVWTNKNYRMIYFNMGHNDMDYDNKTNRQLSSTFSSNEQNRLFVNSFLWLVKSKP